MESKREDLIEATKALLWDIGYEAMSPKKILATSGAGQGSLYHHFKGKMDLAATALAEVEEEMREVFDRIFATDRPPMDRLFRYLDLERNGLNGCRLGRLANEPAFAEAALRKPLARYFRHVEEVVAKTVAEAVARGDLDAAADPERIAATLVATVQGGYVLSRVHRNPDHIRRATDGAAILLEGLARSRPGSGSRRAT